MREIVFGLEDSLVSTLGTITGIAVGADNRFLIILSGLVLIAVEAVSMAAGSYLSSESVIETEQHSGKASRMLSRLEPRPSWAALVMGISYIVGGLIPITPYFFLPVHLSYLPSIFFSIVALFCVGVWSAKYTRRRYWKAGLEMVIISLGAAILGYLVGALVSAWLEQ